MGTLDAPLRNVTQQVLQQFGRTITLRWVSLEGEGKVYPSDGGGRSVLTTTPSGLFFRDLGNGRVGIASDGELVGFRSAGRMKLRAAADADPYDPTMGATESTTDQQVPALEMPFKARPKRPEDRGPHPTPGQDSVFLVAAAGLLLEPSQDMKVLDGGKVLEVLDTDPVWATDQVAMYQLHVRR